jgi:hypothetical protein
MSEPDRGAYAPPTADAPLSFDARQPVRGARPFPTTLLISGLVLLGLIAAIVVFYRTGVREAGQPPQAVGAPVGPIKSPAPADAQPQDPAAGLQIYRDGEATGAGAPKFVPPPEEPAARPTVAAPSAPPPAVQAPPPAPAAPTPRAAPPALRPAIASDAGVPPPAPAAPTPRAEPAPRPVAKAEPAKPPAIPPTRSGVAAVQIGAVSSPALADKTYAEAVSAARGLAAGKGKGVERIDKNGKTLYRTSVTGFASRADAAAFCAKLQAAGKACFVK